MNNYVEILEAKVCQESRELEAKYRFLASGSDAWWKIQLIDALSEDEMNRVERFIFPRDQAFYNLKQGRWLATEAYFLAEKVGHSPTSFELADDFDLTHTPHRYELAHLLSWTWNVWFEDPEDSRDRAALMRFLWSAERKSCIPYCSRYYDELLRRA